MVLAPTLFVVAQVVSLTVYVALAAYVVSCRGPRLANLPFTAFCLTQAFDALSYLLLNSPTAPAAVPELLRLRAAIALLAPPFFIHVALIPLRGTRTRLRQVIVVAAFAFGGTAAFLATFTDRLVTGSTLRGLPGAYILSPLLSPAGDVVLALRLASILILLAPLLIYILYRTGSPRSSSDARRLIVPGLLLLLALGSRAALILLAPAASVSLLIDVAIADRCLSLLAGLFLANNVLRYGSPAGQPIHFGLGPVGLVGGLAVSIDTALLFFPGHTSDAALIAAPPITGFLAGVLLARPELLQLSNRWLGRRPPSESAFADRLRAAWQGMATDHASSDPTGDLVQALQSEISAAYVLVLARSHAAEAGSQGPVFGGSHGEPAVRFLSTDLEWPITELSPTEGRVRFEGLPGPPSLILPILLEGDIAAILTVGEPARGGMYAPGEVIRAELLADLLSAERGNRLALIEHLTAPADHGPSASTTAGEVAIRAFGRLEIVFSRDHLPRKPILPMRPRQLLAYLLTAYPAQVPAEALMERLWPEASPSTASNSLHVAIYALRRTLETALTKGSESRYILHEGDAYRLQLDKGLWVDTHAFEAGYEQGQRMTVAHDPGLAAEEYKKALTLYRGPYLDEAALSQSPEVEAVRHRLRQECEEMARFVMQQLGEEGRWKEAQSLLTTLREADPWDETFAEILGTLHDRFGQLPRRKRQRPADSTGRRG